MKIKSEVIKRNVNDELLEKYTLVDGKLDGEHIVYYPDQTIESVITYKEGVKHGVSTSLDTHGCILTMIVFKEGIQLPDIVSEYRESKKNKKPVEEKKIFPGYKSTTTNNRTL